MKKIILLIVLAFSLSFNANSQDLKCADLKIGKTYIIYGFKSKNPFEKTPKAIVKITRMKHGYVEYCWYYDYNKKNTARFSRSCEEFIEQINNRPEK
jgi:hypothetical protein